MRSIAILFAAVVLAAGMAFLGLRAPAQGDEEEPRKPKAGAAEASQTDEAPVDPLETPVDGTESIPEVRDAGFDRFVDLSELGKALHAHDAARIADVALQLAEGERVLRRSHIAITADKVLQLAVRIAAETRDTGTLDRLERVARDLKKEQLQSMIEAARKVAGVARGVGPTITIDANADLSGLLAYQQFLREIDKARSLHDRESLKALNDGLSVGPEIDEKLRKYLSSQIAEALQQLPDQPTAEDELLRRMSASSRGATGNDEDENVIPPQMVAVSVLNAYNQSIWGYCKANFLRRVGDGQCASLDKAAIENATRRTFRITGSPRVDDYIWGTRVGTIVPGRYGDASLIRPGDLIQLRDASFKGTRRLPNGGTWTYSSTASHHSAVVMGVADYGATIHVFQENSGGKLYVTHGVYHLNDMKSGTIWAYRSKY